MSEKIIIPEINLESSRNVQFIVPGQLFSASRDVLVPLIILVLMIQCLESHVKHPSGGLLWVFQFSLLPCYILTVHWPDQLSSSSASSTSSCNLSLLPIGSGTHVDHYHGVCRAL